jgi:periplasmic copper chaperone A
VTRRIARALVVLVVLVVVPAAYSQPLRGADRDITIRDAWVRASTARRTSSSGYCRIENATDKPVVLVRISAPGVGTAQVHALEEHGAEMTMHPVARLTIPPRGAIDLAPGGRHIMLEDISRPLTIGETLEMQFTFEDGRTRTARAVVRPLDAMSIR